MAATTRRTGYRATCLLCRVVAIGPTRQRALAVYLHHFTVCHQQEDRMARCPECAQGKHPNCDGTTWDEQADATTECPCAASGHTA